MEFAYKLRRSLVWPRGNHMYVNLHTVLNIDYVVVAIFNTYRSMYACMYLVHVHVYVHVWCMCHIMHRQCMYYGTCSGTVR